VQQVCARYFLKVSWRYFSEGTFILFTTCTSHIERKLWLCFKPITMSY